jgi:hypothetical protein
MGIIRRWLEQRERAPKLHARCITILVDANDEDQSAARAIARQHNPGPYDAVIYRGQYGGYDRNLPRLLVITAL